MTSIGSLQDEIVTPQPDASTDDEGTAVMVQDICPRRVAEHGSLLTDAVAFDLAVDALRHPGPASADRIDRSTCRRLPLPGMDPVEASLFAPAALALGLFAPTAWGNAEPPGSVVRPPDQPNGRGEHHPGRNRKALGLPRLRTQPTERFRGPMYTNIRHALFVALGISALFVTWPYAFDWMGDGGNILNPVDFFGDAIDAGGTAAFLSIDMAIAWVVFMLWVVPDAKRVGLGATWGWIFIGLSYIGVSMAFPLYLVVRERLGTPAQRPDAGVDAMAG